MSMSENICNFALQSIIMRDLEPFKIDLKALTNQVATYEFELDDAYFEAIEAPDIQKGNLSVALSIRRIAGSFELSFHIQGFVIVTCDLCLDEMQQPIDTENMLMAKFGEEYSDDDDLIVVPEREGVLDISWFIYEFIDLSVPIKHVHAPGKCNPAMMKKLQELSATRSSLEDGEEPVNPRWAELEKLKTIIKD